MKTLKKILIAVLIIIAIPLIAALFVSKDFKGASEITINKPKQEVFDYVKYVENQRHFGVWFQMDKDITTTSTGTDGTEGYKMEWKSKVVGDGSQTITKVFENDSVLSSLYFGYGEPAKGSFKLKELSANETSVTWSVSGKSPYPFNLMNLFMDMNESFEEGLENLKKVVEAQESPKNNTTIALDYYQETLDKLSNSVNELSEAQLHFKATDSTWSISQCLEHIIITEDMIFGMINGYMEQPENPERRTEIKLSDDEIIAIVTDRSEKFKAPEALIAKGKYADGKTAISDLETQRVDVLSFIKNTPIEALRNRVNDSPVGATDTYQSLLFMAGHTARHTLQIEEIKTNTDFPKN